MIYYVGSVFLTRPDGTILMPLVWRFQVDSPEAFQAMAWGVAKENYGNATMVEFGTIGVSKYTHAV